MRVTLRTKLLAIVGSTAIALLVIIATSTLVATSVQGQLAQIQGHLIPKLELGPRLNADFASLKRAYQDAVAARDLEALDRTRELRDRIYSALDEGHEVLDRATSDAFRGALLEYSEAAFEVSRNMIAGRADENVVERIAAMQKKQAGAQALLDRLVVFDERDLKGAFSAAHDAQASGTRTQLIVMIAGLAFILVLSLRVVRSVVESLGRLQAGFERFGKGTFEEPIRLGGADDELDELAREANGMAGSLAKLAKDREVRDWIKTGIMNLGEELRGDLEEEEVAARATRNLARFLGAPAGALYAIVHPSTADADAGAGKAKTASLRLLGHYALSRGAADGDVAASFTVGEGLVGEAACGTDLVVIEDPPERFLRIRSGLGNGAPRCLVLVPLVLDGRVTGVLELAAFTALSDAGRELLMTARSTIAIAIAVSQSRAATRWLLGKTQDQAARLLAQEEELTSTNEELRCQQEELQQTNEVLALQRSTLEKKNHELQAVGQRLSQKAAELTTVSAYKSQFLANMSHELRTPLNSMLLLSKLLEENADGKLSAKQVEYARTVHSAGRDLLHLINQVLDLAKVEAGKQEIKNEPVRLEDVAARLRRTFAPLAEEKRLRFTVEIAAGLPAEISSDGQRVGQILTNLIGNAIKFTERGEVRLVIGRPARGDGESPRSRTELDPDAAVAFVVHDTGPGIAPEHRARVFAPFEQIDSVARSKPGGTGLGLSISRELASLLGGELRLDSRLGEGSTFSLLLPTARPAQSQTAAVGSKTAPASLSAMVAQGRGVAETTPGDVHLLVIEDDPVFSEVLGEIIRERGLVHVTAKDGTTGLRLARELRPRGIILDVKLPDIDGWRVMEQLRDDPATTAIPVHFITGVDMPDRGLAMGAVGYLIKPTNVSDLVRVVDSLGPRTDGGPHVFLVVETGTALGDQLAGEALTVRRAATAREAFEHLDRESFACVVVDLAVPDLEELAFLERLRVRGGPRHVEMPAVVVSASRPLSRAEATRLEAYAEAVVLKEGASGDRLLDEIRLFVRRLEAGLPSRVAAPDTRDVDIRLEGKKLLVVDDDMRTVYALSATLRAKGAEVLVAETGLVALGVLEGAPDIHAVLMDIMMPEMDGYEAMRRIRAQTRFAELPIVALTAKAMRGDRERCLDAGATDYLPKPVDPNVLLEVLQVHLSAPRREPELGR